MDDPCFLDMDRVIRTHRSLIETYGGSEGLRSPAESFAFTATCHRRHTSWHLSKDGWYTQKSGAVGHLDMSLARWKMGAGAAEIF